ncbi:MAG: threonine aldolase [Candidatus Azotimanducaceae bacterium]|jgi:threonine aldolase
MRAIEISMGEIMVIDLRSDTVTRPSDPMLDAMRAAETGDDVYGEDPTVNRLEALAAKMCGKEAALFGVSGTQTNFLALLSHCQRGHEYIVGHEAHTYKYEGGGAAVLGGIQPCTIGFNDKGELPLNEVEENIKPDDYHFAITKLICLENTQSGQVLSADYLIKYNELINKYNLNSHLDGARVFNAAVKQDVPVSEICRYFDSISICLSKGLGCPAGSLLVGNKEFIHAARRWRKMIGGGMRQAGVLAAAGEYALTNNITKLTQDHDNASYLYSSFQNFSHLKFVGEPDTNMVFLSPEIKTGDLSDFLLERGIRISGSRWVMHKDISKQDVEKIVTVCAEYDKTQR